MDEDFKNEKSRLRNIQAQEIKALEKELKKKKGWRSYFYFRYIKRLSCLAVGTLRDTLEEKIEETKTRHQKELIELATKYGSEKGSKKDKTSEEGPLAQQGYYFPERNWSSLGKKELEIEVVKRGLGKKGNREELVTKLMIFQTDQKKKVEDGLVDPNNIYPEEKKGKERKVVDVPDDDESDSENGAIEELTQNPSRVNKTRSFVNLYTFAVFCPPETVL